MPFPLHKSPAGLLELLRLRTLGASPNTLSEEVRPSFDSTEFYAADLKLLNDETATVGALAALDNVLLLTGPTRVHAIGGRLAIGAAAATNLVVSVGLRQTISGVRVGVGAWQFPAIAAGGIVNFGTHVPPWVLPAASGVGGAWSAFAFVAGTAAGVDHSLSVRVLFDNLLAQ